MCKHQRVEVLPTISLFLFVSEIKAKQKLKLLEEKLSQVFRILLCLSLGFYTFC